MTRQISGSPCREGQTWGADNRGVWVDRGCRAEFGSPAGPRPEPGPGLGRRRQQHRATVITCVLGSRPSAVCNADTSRGVRLVRQVKGNGCVEGSTWGFDSRGIWVDRGCAGRVRGFAANRYPIAGG